MKIYSFFSRRSQRKNNADNLGRKTKNLRVRRGGFFLLAKTQRRKEDSFASWRLCATIFFNANQ